MKHIQDYEELVVNLIKWADEDPTNNSIAATEVRKLIKPFRPKPAVIKLTGAEIQSGFNRQQAAEGLIVQLPSAHGGRNTWLLNYGVLGEAIALREKRGVEFDEDTQSAYTSSTDFKRPGSIIERKSV